jgi:hypothetical protein
LFEEGRITVLGSIPFRKIENLFRSDLYDPTELVLMDRLKTFPLESIPYFIWMRLDMAGKITF